MIGLGASTALFSAVNIVLLRPLPYSKPEWLAIVTEGLPAMSADEIGASAGEYIDYRDRNCSFSQAASFETAEFNLTGEGRPLRVNAAQISLNSTFVRVIRELYSHTAHGQDRSHGGIEIRMRKEQ